MAETIFLKLGGSLITNKDQAHTALTAEMDAIGAQILRFRQDFPDVRLLVGHGSGSFGHVAAKKYGTRNGVHSAEEWQGFLEVWREAHALDEILLERFTQLGLPVLSFPLSAGALTRQGQVESGPPAPSKWRWITTSCQSSLAMWSLTKSWVAPSFQLKSK